MPSRSTLGTLAAYWLVLLASYVFFTQHFFHIDFIGGRAQAFSWFYIPLLTLLVHLVLLRLLPFWGFLALLGIDGFLDVAVSVHHAYFGEAPSLLSLTMAYREASAGIACATAFIPRGLVVFVLLRIAAVGTIAYRLRNFKSGKALRFGAGALAPLLVLSLVFRPPTEAALYTTYGVCIRVQGLYLALINNLTFHYIFVPPPDPAEADHSLRLDPALFDIPDAYLDFPIVIQVESLDWSVLGHQVDGRSVTPFLNELRNSALTLCMDPKHTAIAGSSGADFQFLSQQLVKPGVLPAKQEGLERLESLPKSLAKTGMRTVAMHGNTANFWARNRGYARLGIDAFIDLHAYPAADAGWGVSDASFFSSNLEKMQHYQDKPTLTFMITLSSHAPFKFVDNPVFRGRGIISNYFNSINYTDRCMAGFLSKVPGRHLVMIYGDHSANLTDETYTSKINGKEAIPGFVFLLEDGRPKTLPLANPPRPVPRDGGTIITLSHFLQDLEMRRPRKAGHA